MRKESSSTCMTGDIYFVVGAGGFIGRNLRRRLEQAGRNCRFPSHESAPADLRQLVMESAHSRLVVINLAWPNTLKVASTAARLYDDAEWQRYLSWLQMLMLSLRPHPNHSYFGVGTGIERYAACAGLVGEPYLTYARRKDVVRELVRRELSEKSVWLRLHFIFGPYESPSRFVPAALSACRNRRPMVLNAPERKRHWLHVDDVVDGLMAAMVCDAPRDWDIVGPDALQFREICKLVEIQVGRELILQSGPQTADSNCISVEPEAIAPFMSDRGSKQDIVRQLANYDAWLKVNDRIS